MLGVRTAQLNHDMLYADTGRRSNQVFTWKQAGLLDVAPRPEEVGELVALASRTDASAGLELRVRSYWDANCSMCHGSVAGLRSNWDARFKPRSNRRV